MKLLLVDPPDLFLRGHGHTRHVQPLGLAYIGAFLAPHHDVRFLLPDTRAYRGEDPWGMIATAILEEAPDVVGITAVTAQYPSARRLAEVAKEVDPTIVTVLGGTHATSLPAQALREAPCLDYLVAGEGELTMRELLAGLEQGNLRPAEVLGLVWRDGEEIRRNPPRPSLRELDRLPFPLRDNLVWPQDIQPAFYQAMVTLRGCPYRCIYCAVPSSNDRKTRYRSATNVVDEIEQLRTRYRIPYLFFHDSVFTLNRKRTVRICEQMLERGQVVPFACQTRADRVTPELLDLMKRAGCHQIFFGIESGDVDSLKKIKKSMALETIREAVAWVKERGIRCTGFFMVGFPWENEALIRQTADFACAIDLDAISLFSATPLPGTELWDMAGGSHLPDSIDFTTPQVNLTGLGTRYPEVFAAVKAQIDRYNLGAMQRSMAAAWTARRSWMDG